MKINQDNSQRLNPIDIFWLLIWLILGLILRFSNLNFKPASSIEIATIGYSLGHGFSAIPLDQIISLDTLLSPLRFDSGINYTNVLERLIQESTHPPLYFWLTHWWVKLWVHDGNIVSLQVARSLSAILGALAVPAIFSLGWMTFRSRLVAHLAAVLMAISPYGIYLAQEARHYTLTILWVIASLTCLVKTMQLIQQRIAVRGWLIGIWIVVNALGIATHYFFVLALGAEAIAIIVFWLSNPREQTFKQWRSIYLVGWGTLVSGLVWLPIVRGISDNELTSWITTSFEPEEILEPIPRILAWLITMVMMLPVEGISTWGIIISALIILAVLIWVIPTLIQGWRSLLIKPQTRMPAILLGSYFVSSIVIFFLIIYGMRKDISLAARYHFVYFPAFILLVAAAMAAYWGRERFTFSKDASWWSKFSAQAIKNKVVVVLLIVGFLGSLTVVNNLGFQKSRHSDCLAIHIQANSNFPALVAMTHQTHSELRELIGLAFSFQRLNSQDEFLTSQSPQFLLVQQYKSDIDITLPTLSRILTVQSKPLNLFGVNLQVDEERLPELGCTLDSSIDLSNSGYRDRFYHCE
ncbi:hypothetical protein [Pleurocapsa sp. PCC 7319]|uniref:glycosyltransferase family 39 protein n=1 Tax=Pleurocapsa sp. PCC 7319 TaxID=118161 RepID=UPI00034A2599|nr:hypothetical protein [Pleurocapsa sp. PCC 7319]